jgi:S1-C subfamily serine protease
MTFGTKRGKYGRWYGLIACAAALAMMVGCSAPSSNASQSTSAPTAAQNVAINAVGTPLADATTATVGSTAAATTAADTSTQSVSSTTNATSQGDATSTTSNATAAATSQPAASGNEPNLTVAVRQVAQMDKPAVVQITNEQVQLDQYNQAYTVPAGVGSGVIYDAQGHILTNNHVIAGAQQLEVSLTDGRVFSGTLVGQDPQSDLAVIQITGDNLPVAQLGDSSKLQVGDWVVAIGNALALPGGPTVSAGVASALGRTVQEPGDANNPNSTGPFLFDVIQTSAPINPGNSGGPLVDLNGRVVGIDTLVAGQAEPGVPSQGIGFAIAINTAKPIADQLVATGHAAHPFIGISYVPLTPAIAAQIGTQAKTGIVVADVVAGSPAGQAGLQQSDVITAVDGNPMQDESDLARALSRHKPGDTIQLTVMRGSNQSDVSVTLADRPAQ